MLFNRRSFVIGGTALPIISACSKDPGAKLIGTKTPEIIASTTDGQKFHLAHLERPAVFHFFGLWCPVCMKDRHLWELALRELNKINEISVLTFHVGNVPTNYISLESWQEKLDSDVRTPLINDDKQTIFNLMKIPGTPSTLLIDSGGRIIEHQWNFKSKRAVRAFVIKTKEVFGIQ